MPDSDGQTHNKGIPKNRKVEGEYHLARALQLKGSTHEAIKRFMDITRTDPDFVPAYVQLGDLMLHEGRARQALDYYQKALEIDPQQPLLKSKCEFLMDIINGEKEGFAANTSYITSSIDAQLVNNPDGKINLKNQLTFKTHRSGWKYAIHALKPLHNEAGVLFDGFIEKNFASEHFREGVRPARVLDFMRSQGTFDRLATSEEKGITPYTTPWVGFIHNPQAMPEWFLYQVSNQRIFAKDIWKESLPSCIGLFTLSEYHARWLRTQTGVPVSSLIHPSEIPEVIFDFDRFVNNPRKKIVQVGWWLRKLNAISQMPLAADNRLGCEKIRLIPDFSNNAHDLIKRLMSIEKEVNQVEIDPVYAKNTREIHHLPDHEYDQLLSENIVFIELYDANANNTIVECIARGTPILVNPLPAVVEYLGEDYPLYFNNLPEAAEKALDLKLILEAHQYLMECETRGKLGSGYFLKSFCESEVYRLIGEISSHI
jgi:tetratricopeptide (TPR) repeat protein